MKFHCPLFLIFQNLLARVAIEGWFLCNVTDLIGLGLNLTCPDILPITSKFLLSRFMNWFILFLLYFNLMFQKVGDLRIFHELFQLFNRDLATCRWYVLRIIQFGLVIVHYFLAFGESCPVWIILLLGTMLGSSILGKLVLFKLTLQIWISCCCLDDIHHVLIVYHFQIFGCHFHAEILH